MTDTEQIMRQAKEIRQLRETNRRLNRRCQQVEKAAKENIEVCRRKGVSFGRGLANYTCVKLAEENKMLRAELERLIDVVGEEDRAIIEGVRNTP